MCFDLWKESIMKQPDLQQQAVQAAAEGFWQDSMQTLESRLAWWRDARFGMFIHWASIPLPAVFGKTIRRSAMASI